jgi:hypothetical protein
MPETKLGMLSEYSPVRRRPVTLLTPTGHSFEELLANAAILRLYTVMEWATVGQRTVLASH